ncbi:TauD/TfdA family dioxygenase [Actinocrispum wychmicini]|uniref:TauD/TfdA family dioxygenase n=1 Tax=Actinocrispum wychmicini TaxID=1213861 RepID=UPI001404AF90|nr:TauD/TfdA family dioxygenase [Actinocrispum wychmicini]
MTFDIREVTPTLMSEVDEILTTTGVVLLRGLGISSPAHFHETVAKFGEPLGGYRGGNTPRTKVADGIFTSTEYPAEYEISLHNELSYAQTWPDRLFFCCLTEPTTGGATPVCDGRALLSDLDPDVRDRFTTKGIVYRQHLHGGYGPGKSWQRTFETDNPAEAEKFLHAAGLTFNWTPDNGLRTSAPRPAIRTHPKTGTPVWFNQADQWHPTNLPPTEREALLDLFDNESDLPHSVTYGDGSPIPSSDVDAIRTAAKRNELSFPWQRGDIMIVENMLALHGRHPYTGPRKILVAMI